MRRTYRWDRGAFVPLSLAPDWPDKVQKNFDAWRHVARRDYPGFDWIPGAEVRTIERIRASNAAVERDIVEIIAICVEEEFDDAARAYIEAVCWEMRDVA